MEQVKRVTVSSATRVLPLRAVHSRWQLRRRGEVHVLDLGSGVMKVPSACAGPLLDALLPAEQHYAAVASEEDPDLARG